MYYSSEKILPYSYSYPDKNMFREQLAFGEKSFSEASWVPINKAKTKCLVRIL